MTVAPARIEDVDRLVEMGRRMHGEGAFAFLPYAPEKVRQMIVGLIENPETRCALVARNDSGPIGMLGGYLTDYFFCDQTLACDLVLFVEPAYRGGPAAARLIEAFRQWAIARGARELCLAVSNNVQPDTVARFYKTLGFTQVGGIFKVRL